MTPTKNMVDYTCASEAGPRLQARPKVGPIQSLTRHSTEVQEKQPKTHLNVYIKQGATYEHSGPRKTPGAPCQHTTNPKYLPHDTLITRLRDEPSRDSPPVNRRHWPLASRSPSLAVRSISLGVGPSHPTRRVVSRYGEAPPLVGVGSI